MERRFYVYAHHRADDGVVFYIGKGCGRRAHAMHGRSEHWSRIVAKHGLRIEFLAVDLTEGEAFDLERMEIARHPGLCNATDGGEGVSGYQHTEESRRAMSAAHAGRKQRPEVVEARALKLRGLKRSPQVMSAWVSPMKGRTHSPETKARMSASRAGVPRSPMAVARTADRHRGMKRTPEARANMSDAQRKRPVRCLCTGVSFPSLTAAAAWVRESGRPTAGKAAIGHALTGRNATAYGYRWAYADA